MLLDSTSGHTYVATIYIVSYLKLRSSHRFVEQILERILHVRLVQQTEIHHVRHRLAARQPRTGHLPTDRRFGAGLDALDLAGGFRATAGRRGRSYRRRCGGCFLAGVELLAGRRSRQQHGRRFDTTTAGAAGKVGGNGALFLASGGHIATIERRLERFGQREQMMAGLGFLDGTAHIVGYDVVVRRVVGLADLMPRVRFAEAELLWVLVVG